MGSADRNLKKENLIDARQPLRKFAVIKKLLIAAAVVMASSPAFVSAQDFFFSFDEFSRVPTANVASGTATGSVFIFSDENFDFNQLDLDFTIGNNSVVSFTGATTFNSPVPANEGGFVGSTPIIPKFSLFTAVDPNGPPPQFFFEDPDGPPLPITPTDGRLFALSVALLEIPRPGGIDPAHGPSGVDADFRAGANGFLLARVDFDIVGDGTANFDFILGALGVADNETGPVTPNLIGSTATLTVGGVPGPVVIRGDADQDGDVDFSDIPLFISFLQSGIFQAESDADGNGAVEFADIPVFISILKMQP